MPALKHLNSLDYLVVAVYLLIVLGTGVYVSRFNRRTSDYFKGGGHIPWGMSMVSLFISGFSAFMFVGAAGVAYKSGTSAMVLFSLAMPAYLLGYWIYGPLWRRTRIDTPLQFVQRRFSSGTTYCFTLLSVIPNVLLLGVMIYTLCIFVSTALGFNKLTFEIGNFQIAGFQLSMLVIGAVMVFYTMVGGLWAVMVTDALQFLILLLVSLTLLPLAYSFLGDGSISAGVTRLIQEAPAGYFDFGIKDRPALFWVAYFANIVLGYNVNWHIAQRYYSVPDERDTKKMALWCSGLSLILPLTWILPVMASSVLFPDLNSMWPELTEPSEAAFVTLAMAILPHGMLGVMVAAILAATMSSVDTTFNWLAAVVTKDGYVPLAQRVSGRTPSERVQLLCGKLSVAVMGVIAIWIALNMDKYGGAFDVYLKVDSLIKPPMFIPVILGLVLTRTPWWSGMAAFVGGVVAILTGNLLANYSQGLPFDSFGAILMSIKVEVAGLELGRYELNTLIGISVSMTIFFVSAFFNRRRGDFAERITSLEHDLRTPAHAESGTMDLSGMRAYRFAGWLAILIGGLLILLAIPTYASGGASLNLVAGTLAVAIGAGVVNFTRRIRKRLEAVEN